MCHSLFCGIVCAFVVPKQLLTKKGVSAYVYETPMMIVQLKAKAW